MNQHLVSIFSIVKEDKVFQFMTGNATVDEVLSVVDEFKKGFEDLKVRLLEQEEARKKEKESAQEVVNTEVVSESH